MRITGIQDGSLISELEEWEKNRMYPPNHTGEIMITPKDSHLKALARAQYFMQSGITPSMQPKHREQIDKDIRLLDEVHSFCRLQIMEPGLPVIRDVPKEPAIEDTNGNSDRPATVS